MCCSWLPRSGQARDLRLQTAGYRPANVGECGGEMRQFRVFDKSLTSHRSCRRITLSRRSSIPEVCAYNIWSLLLKKRESYGRMPETKSCGAKWNTVGWVETEDGVNWNSVFFHLWQSLGRCPHGHMWSRVRSFMFVSRMLLVNRGPVYGAESDPLCGIFDAVL